METEEIKKCRSCGNETLIPIISLGNQCVVNFVASEDVDCVKSPLDLVLCNNCKLLQLRHNAPPESMWGEQYWYKSGINPTIRGDLKDIVENIEKMMKLNEGNIVVDIGCNDGTMLEYYQNEGMNKVGFEPSVNVAKEAASKGFEIINNFFNKENYQEKFGDKKAKVITAISMFYDLEDPNLFLEDIKTCLDDDGLFVIQQNYLITMLKNNGLDNICHEHREYYSMTALNHLLQRHDLEIFDVILNGINGGSIRTYIRKKGSKVNASEGAQERIDSIKKEESDMKLETSEPYLNFALRGAGIKQKIMEFIAKEKAKGKIICGSGASTKGNTTLQYFGLGPNEIKAIGDKNPDKFGKKTVGSLIPIDSPEKVDEMNPDYLFVLIWYFLEDIKRNHQDFLDKGGQFIVPFPVPKVISKNGEVLI